MISISNSTITINNNICLLIAIMHVEEWKMMRQSDHEQVLYNSNKFVVILNIIDDTHIALVYYYHI